MLFFIQLVSPNCNKTLTVTVWGNDQGHSNCHQTSVSQLRMCHIIQVFGADHQPVYLVMLTQLSPQPTVGFLKNQLQLKINLRPLYSASYSI